MNNVEKRVKEHYEFAVKKYGESRVLGVFLTGSQNYGLATEDSDVDTKCLVLPTISNLLNGNEMISVEEHIPVDGKEPEHCLVKDIRLFIKEVKKQNINFVEVFYTNYYYINNIYFENMKKLIFVGKKIFSRYDETKNHICCNRINSPK